MTKLIDADALVAQIEKECCINCVHRKSNSGRFIYDIGDAPCKACGTYDAIDWIEYADEIDAVPVVRCHDCKWYDTDACQIRMSNYGLKDYGYCDYGERKDDEAD